MANKLEKKKAVETLKHQEASRKNIPTAEFQSVMAKEDLSPIRVAYERRNRDLDPQLVWRGKDEQDWSDLVTHAPPLYIQEKVHPKVLIDDLLRRSAVDQKTAEDQFDLFADFNGVPEGNAKTEFYQHDANWSNRMILGDSFHVMASLAEREGLRGQVQCIYFDPPYGIRFNSNFQWSTTDKAGTGTDSPDKISREPEQVKAFRDTWRDGVNSYLTYFRDRLTVARDLLADSGSIFVQIGDENVHLLRAILDEVFGDKNFVNMITAQKTTGAGSFAGGTDVLASLNDYVLWYCRSLAAVKYRQLFIEKAVGGMGATLYTQVAMPDGTVRSMTKLERRGMADLPKDARPFGVDNITSQTTRVGQTTVFPVEVNGSSYLPRSGGWKTNRVGMSRLQLAQRVARGGASIGYVRYVDDFPAFPMANNWTDTVGQNQYGGDKVMLFRQPQRSLSDAS